MTAARRLVQRTNLKITVLHKRHMYHLLTDDLKDRSRDDDVNPIYLSKQMT